MPYSTIPGPAGRWLVGDLMSYEKDRIGWLTRSRKEYGDVVRVTPNMVAIHDIDLARHVLGDSSGDYYIDTALATGKQSIEKLFAGQQGWLEAVRLGRRKMADQLDEGVARLVRAGRCEIETVVGTSCDIAQLCRRICGRGIVYFCLGGGFESAAELTEIRNLANLMFECSAGLLASAEVRFGWLPRSHAREVRTVDRRLREVIAACVTRRRHASPSAGGDLLDSLIASGAGDEEIVRTLRMILFASHGVPGVALSWTLLRLASNPEVAAQIGAESADAAMAGDFGAASLPYTVAVLREVLRLHPPQWLVTRTSRRPVQLGDYHVKPQQQVLICPYLLHRDERWWDDPDSFRPMRWLDNGRPYRRPAYLPFGAGVRMCPGTSLAMAQLALLTSLFAREYRIEAPAVDEAPLESNGLLVPAGVVCRIMRR